MMPQLQDGTLCILLDDRELLAALKTKVPKLRFHLLAEEYLVASVSHDCLPSAAQAMSSASPGSSHMRLYAQWVPRPPSRGRMGG
mmetsp:Transcript_136161/g.339570  ORF Transcript_136161/g.339570 Transcript_136161/m.339570 type:complete len:85 (-) Transcript_136161:6-260(-)